MKNKRFIFIFAGYFIALIAAFIFIFNYVNKPSILYSDGTYNGIAEGRNDNIEISITISDGKIVDASIISESETGFAKPAIQDILDQAISNGNMDAYDAMSGCTISSNATAEAVKDALKKAIK